MNMLRSLILMILPVAPMAAQSETAILARLDRAATQFVSATANLTWIDHQAVIDVEDKQSGSMAVKRYSSIRAQYLVRFTDPDQYAVALRDDVLERYTPKNNLIQEYDIKRYRDLAQTLMLLGFGMSGRQLAGAFAISQIRNETVASQRTTHLDLTPKSPDTLRQVSHIELWISEELACAVQQKFHYPGGSYKLVTFTNLRLNPKLDSGALELPRNVRREKVR